MLHITLDACVSLLVFTVFIAVIGELVSEIDIVQIVGEILLRLLG